MSISNSTFWCFSSRKYSAMVSAVSPTRQRAPGGSFIWPNTSTVRASTPDSRMSVSSSWPSRDRSPTPANTEMPWYRSTIAWISSITSTVLPTPAPPNIAALPPCASGTSRSITLMPVSNTARRGGLRGQRRRRAMDRPARRVRRATPAPRSRTSPITSSSRPSTASPTGTVIGPPVALHRGAARQSGCGLQRDRAHRHAIEMALHLGDQRRRPIPLDPQRRLDRRQRRRLEGDVEHGATHRDDAAARRIRGVRTRHPAYARWRAPDRRARQCQPPCRRAAPARA